MSKGIPERVAPQYTVKGFFIGLTIVGLISGAFFLYFIKRSIPAPGQGMRGCSAAGHCYPDSATCASSRGMGGSRGYGT